MTSRVHDYMPGVPAAGHITSGGYWHPGPATSCFTCQTPAQRWAYQVVDGDGSLLHSVDTDLRATWSLLSTARYFRHRARLDGHPDARIQWRGNPLMPWRDIP